MDKSKLNINVLKNPNALPQAKRLMHYLIEVYGRQVISGQQEAPSANPPEFDFLQEQLGKQPAVRCLDYLHYSPAVNRPDGVTERAVDWVQRRGGMVSICWHWFAPAGGASFYTKDTSFDVTRAVTPGTEEYELVLHDLDRIAEELKVLQDAGIPVLWRPLHEADGAWFWWGAKGPEPCRKLFYMMFERFTKIHQLHHLIWVWTFAKNEVASEWYPGDEYIDIVGIDKYFEPGDHTANNEGFSNLMNFSDGRKIITMPENGPIPDPSLLQEESASWLWFCPWWGKFVTDGETNSCEFLRAVYHHDYVITLDKLPQNLYE